MDYSWLPKIPNMDVTILITKNITKKFADTVLELHQRHQNIILHCTCTGWGGTFLEPGVPHCLNQLEALRHLIDRGFPENQCVLRIDPIIPTQLGIQNARFVLNYARRLELFSVRVRVSVLDEYKHVKERLLKQNIAPFYPDGRFYASKDQMTAVSRLLEEFPNITFEACAEPYLAAKNLVHTGCVSVTDLRLFNLKPDTTVINIQKRSGCLCLACKTELLSTRHPCKHNCQYCYWKKDGE